MRCAYARKESLEAILLRPVSFGDDVRSISFNGRDSDPATLKAFGPGKTRIEAGSVSFNGRRKNPNCNNTSLKSPTFKPENASPLKRGPLDSSSPKHQAAVKLQKVYKSFRTRRQLADCAVLVEQIWRRWSQVLDFAMLKQSSVSFFERPESAFSRWSRARRRAAMVGKGLSKNEKAQKLALQHWLEAIDPRHRYGHNLHFYYDCWLQCESTEPFFYWLDVGEGKEVNLKEQCPRSMLQQQCIKYLDRNEREAYEVVIEDGKFIYKQSRQILDTSGGINDEKWIFVLSTSGALYVGQKMKGKFQHSSFLAGGATCAAGQLEVENGVLKTVWPHSGHYRPTAENFQQFMSFLEENKVDLTDVKKCGKGGTDELCGEPEVNFAGKTSNDGAFGDMKSIDKQIIIVEHHDEGEEEVEVINVEHKASNNTSNLNRFYSFRPRNLLAKGQEDDDDEEEEEEEKAAAFRAPSHTIPGRINSNKLRNQLPLTWTTGAGPRIQCVRDYPSGLQFRALAQMCLSPRCGPPVNASQCDSQRRIEDIRLYQ